MDKEKTAKNRSDRRGRGLTQGIAGFLEDLFVGGEANEASPPWVMISRVAPTAEGKSGGGECGGEIGVDV